MTAKTPKEWSELFETLSREKILKEIAVNFPDKEITYNDKCFKVIGIILSDDYIRYAMVGSRYNTCKCPCLKSDSETKLMRCENCKLVFYCSQKCKEEYSNTHKDYCCNKNFNYNPDKDYYKPVFRLLEKTPDLSNYQKL